MNKKKDRRIISLLVIILLISCKANVSRVDKGVSGVYSFEYPRGDYQVLEIYEDSSFVQKFYIDKKSFEDKVSPFYENRGIWSVYLGKELEFTHWLKYCSRRNPDSILKHPKRITMLNVYWKKPNKENNGYLSVSYDDGYVFMKQLDTLVYSK